MSLWSPQPFHWRGHGCLLRVRSDPVDRRPNGRHRRVSPVAGGPGEGPLSEPTAAARAWGPELVFMPLSGPTARPAATPHDTPKTGLVRGPTFGEIWNQNSIR